MTGFKARDKRLTAENDWLTAHEGISLLARSAPRSDDELAAADSEGRHRGSGATAER
jgi:hypothetical protein